MQRSWIKPLYLLVLQYMSQVKAACATEWWTLRDSGIAEAGWHYCWNTLGFSPFPPWHLRNYSFYKQQCSWECHLVLHIAVCLYYDMLLTGQWTSYSVGHRHFQCRREKYITNKRVICATLYPVLLFLHLSIFKLNNFEISFLCLKI